MDPFPLPREEAQVTEIHQRLGRQQQIVEAITAAMTAKLAEVSAPRDDAVDQITRAMKKIARRRIKDNEGRADYIVSQMAHQVGTRLAGQQMIVNDLTGATMTGAVQRATGKRPYTGPQGRQITRGAVPPPPLPGAPGDCPQTGPPCWTVWCPIPGGAGPVIEPAANFQQFFQLGWRPLGQYFSYADAEIAVQFAIDHGELCGPAIGPGGPPPPPPPPLIVPTSYILYVRPADCTWVCRPAIDQRGFPEQPPAGYERQGDFYASSADCEAAGRAWQADCPGAQPPDVPWWEIWGNVDTCDAVCVLYGDNPPPGYKRIVGPYFDRGECELAATQWEDECAPPPPPPVEVNECPDEEGETCPAFPADPLTADDQCKIPGFPGSIPIPGSEEWCRRVPEIRQGLVAAGKWLLDFATDDVSEQTESLPEWAGVLVKLNPMYYLIRYNRAVARWLIDWLFSARSKLKDLIVCWRALVKLSPGCDPDEVLALAVVRGVVGMMEHFRFGVELPVLAASELSFHLPQLSRALDYLLESACPSKIPGPPEAMEAYLQGQIDYLTYRCWLEAHGVSADVVAPVLAARAHALDARETIEWGRRNQWSDDDIKKEVEDRGWGRNPDLARKMELYDELPTTGDFLHWMARNIFDDEYVQDYQLDQGFEERFWSKFGVQMRARGITKETAKRHYEAHWLPSSPSEMREWMFRLRPEKVGEDNAFTPDDYRRLLVEQDKPPRHIQWYMDTAYNVPAFSYLTLLYRFHLIDDASLYSYLQDQGYTPEDAKLMAQGMGAMKERTREEDAVAYTPDRIGQLFRAGLIKENEARQRLREQGFNQGESSKTLTTAVLRYQLQIQDRARSTARTSTWRAILNAYQTGTVSGDAAREALVTAGWPVDAVTAILAVGDVKARDALAKKAIAALRRAYLDGQLNDQTALTALTSAGITGERPGQYLQEWQLEKLAAQPHASVSQILGWVAQGLLPVRTARTRLLNLGWADPDLLLQLASAQLKLSKAEAAEQAALDRASARTRKGESLTLLKERYKGGHITRDYVETSLHASGYSPSAISLYLDQWSGNGQAAPAIP